MKKILFLALLLVLVVCSVLCFSACDVISIGKPPETPPSENNPPNPVEPEEPTVEYVNLILKENTLGTTVREIKVVKGTAPTAENVNAVLNAEYHGYTFATWTYTKYSGGASAEFDPEAILNEDTVLYGSRGNLAGKGITWSYDDTTKSLIITGDGEMFNYTYNDDAPWVNYSKLVERIVFEGSITNIGDYSFYEFEALTDVTLPETTTRLGKGVFYRCSRLTKINFPDTLLTIDNSAFFKCDGFTELVFNEGLNYVGKDAFYQCYGVTKITLTDKISEFGASAFYQCANLKTAYYYGTEEDYNKLIFRLDNFWATQLANTYFISEDKPAAPGPYWYYDSEGNIKQWYYTVGFKHPDEILPFAWDYVDAVSGVDEENVKFMNDIVYHGYRFNSWSARAYGVQAYEVGLILDRDIHLTGNRGSLCGDSAYFRLSGTTLQILGSGRIWDFEGIKDAPWYGRNYTSVEIAEGITHLGSYMFCHANSLVSMDIPTNITSIHKNAYVGCNNLMFIYYLGTGDELASVEGAEGLENLLNAVVYARTEVGDEPLSDGAYWCERTDRDTLLERRVAWTLKDGHLTVGGDPTLVNYASVTDTPWYVNRDTITSVEILTGANRVGYNSFDGMEKITSITIPSTVLKIGDTAFTGTGYYTDADNWVDGALYISNHLIKVDSSTVGERFAIKDNTLSIADGAFLGCESVTELVFVKEIRGVFKAALEPLSLEKIFYTGNQISSWEGVWSKNNNLASQDLGDAVIYCLSVYEPTTEGNFWYKTMKNDGSFDITVWEPVITDPDTSGEGEE